MDGGTKAFPSEPDEAALVTGARECDEAAIRAIIGRHNRRLFRLARSILPSDDEAEDAVQEGYVRALRGLAGFRGEASLSTWLCRIVINEALGRTRRRRPMLELAVLEAADRSRVIPFPASAPASDPERNMAQDEIRRMVEREIDALPAAFRTVLVARLVEEMSVEETAAALDLRPETVKTRLHRARLLLRAALEKRLGAVLSDAFPFDGERCRHMADRVIKSLPRAI